MYKQTQKYTRIDHNDRNVVLQNFSIQKLFQPIFSSYMESEGYPF